MSFNDTVKLKKNHLMILFALLVVMSPLAAAAVGPNWIEQWGIRWTFDKNISATGAAGTYHYGTFINGDYWVVGPVSVISINPPCQTVNGRLTHGSQVNPTNGWVQGYDAKAPWYDDAVNVGRNVSSATPLKLSAHSSLVSTQGLSTPTHLTQMSDAAILTVLAEVPAKDAFRPAYCGTDKRIRYTRSSLNTAVLKKLTAVPGIPDLAIAERDYERPRIDHAPVPHGQKIRPLSNYNGSVYGREIAKASARAALLLNFNFSDAEKETLLVRFVQYGIDLFGIIQTDGKGWHGDGGMGSGRKLPILFAGMVLGDDAMASIGDISGDYLYTKPYGPGNRPPAYKDFGEDAQVFYVDQLEVDITATSVGSWWRPDSRDQAVPYKVSDIGLPEWAPSHSHYPQKCTNWWDAIYRSVAGSSFPGTAMAARIMGLQTRWNNPAFFDYCDRYMTIITTDPAYAGWQSGTNGVGEFVFNLWQSYRDDYGPVWPDRTTQPQTYTLLISAAHGTVTPAESTYTAGTVVTLTAAADPGYLFERWDGDATGTQSTVSVLMDGDKSVTAVFVEAPVETPPAVKSAPVPLAKWHFNEADGPHAADVSGRQLHGTLNATVQRSSDMGSVVFNGTDSYITCGNADALNPGASLTLSLWVRIARPDANDYLTLISKKATWNSNSGYALEYNPALNRLLVLGSGSSYVWSDQASLDTGWHHLVATLDGTTAALYLDGVRLSTSGSIQPVTASSVPFEIGREDAIHGYFDGALDDVLIFDQALADDDVAALYQKGRNNELSSHYLFDDTLGAQATDSSGCRRVGTLVNAPAWGQAWATQEYLAFQGGDQAVEICLDAASAETGTLAMRVEPSSVSGPRFLFGHTLDGGNRIWLYTISGQLSLGLGDHSARATHIAALEAGRLYHVALTWDRNRYTVYIDGTAAAAGDYTGLTALAPTADIANMGTAAYRSQGLGFDGLVDDVQIYRRPLGAAEIQALAAAQTIKENKTLAFYLFGEKPDGSVLTYTASNLPDGASFDPATHEFTWRPWYNQSGEYLVDFTSKDGTDRQTVTLLARDVALSDWYRDFLTQQGKL